MSATFQLLAKLQQQVTPMTQFCLYGCGVVFNHGHHCYKGQNRDVYHKTPQENDCLHQNWEKHHHSSTNMKYIGGMKGARQNFQHHLQHASIETLKMMMPDVEGPPCTRRLLVASVVGSISHYVARVRGTVLHATFRVR